MGDGAFNQCACAPTIHSISEYQRRLRAIDVVALCGIYADKSMREVLDRTLGD